MSPSLGRHKRNTLLKCPTKVKEVPQMKEYVDWALQFDSSVFKTEKRESGRIRIIMRVMFQGMKFEYSEVYQPPFVYMDRNKFMEKIEDLIIQVGIEMI